MRSDPWPGPRARHGGIDEVPLPGGAGRLWLCGKHLVGPDPEAALSGVGASTIVCLNERFELVDRYPDYVAWLVGEAGGRAVWHPIPDLHAPTADAARGLLAEVHRRLLADEGVILHCGAGIGRAGTIAVGLLMTMGASLHDASNTVARSRPTAGPEAGVQTELLQELAARLR